MDMDLRHKAWGVRNQDMQQEIEQNHRANASEHHRSIIRSAAAHFGHTLVSLGTHLESLEQDEKSTAFLPARGH